jgi:hypothetical protein
MDYELIDKLGHEQRTPAKKLNPNQISNVLADLAYFCTTPQSFAPLAVFLLRQIWIVNYILHQKLVK